MIERRHLEAFIAVAEELHFGRAAKRLHLSQPAVSQAIQALEEEVGVALLERTRRVVAVTVAGERFLEHARRALAEVERGVHEAQRAARSTRASLTLAYSGALSLSPLPPLLAQYRCEHPEVELTLAALSTEAQFEALALARCDVGCTFIAPRADELVGLSAFRCAPQPLFAIVPAASALAEQPTLSFAQLREQPVIMLDARVEPALKPLFEGVLSGAAPRVALEVGHLDAMLALVASGFGISFAPRPVEQTHAHGVRFVPVAPAVEIAMWLLWSRANVNPALAGFLALFVEPPPAPTAPRHGSMSGA